MTPSDLYCRLYVNSPGDLQGLRAKIAEEIDGTVAGRNVLNALIDFYVVQNDYSDPERLEQNDGFIYYPFTAEVEVGFGIEDEFSSIEASNFMDVLCRTIVNLRNSGMHVVASCAYDDEIREKTGWNWSVDTPVHP